MSLSGLIACGVSLVIGVPVLFGGGGDESTTIAALAPTSTTVEGDTQSSLLDDVDVTAAFGSGARLLAEDLVEPSDDVTVLDAIEGLASASAASSADRAVQDDAGASATPTAEGDPAPPATAVSTTDASASTAAPTTAAPATAAPTTAAPETTAPPTTEAPTTAAPTPATEAPAAETPAEEVPAAQPSGPPTAEQWAALRDCESGGNYTIVSTNGLYHGAYQFGTMTWDNSARAAGRTDLIGVLPSQASAADQDALALSLWTRRGNAPWPHCGMHIPDNV